MDISHFDFSFSPSIPAQAQQPQETITDWFGWEEILKTIEFQPPAMDKD